MARAQWPDRLRSKLSITWRERIASLDIPVDTLCAEIKCKLLAAGGLANSQRGRCRVYELDQTKMSDMSDIELHSHLFKLIRRSFDACNDLDDCQMVLSWYRTYLPRQQ